MKIVQAVKFASSESKKAILIFYGALYAIFIISFTLSKLYDMEFSFGGIDISSSIFVFVLGLNSFKDNFSFYLTNGLSRKTIYISNQLYCLAIAFVMSFVDCMTNIITSSLTINSGLFNVLYRNNGRSFSYWLWSAFAYLFFLALGLSISMLFYRLSKLMKFVVYFGVPVFIFIVLPILDLFFFGDSVRKFFAKYIPIILGINTGNPYVAVVSFIVMTGILILLQFLMLRRAVLKES